MGQFGHPHWEDDMAHSYAHGPSMSNYLVFPTTIFQTCKITQPIITSNVVGVIYYK